MVPSLLYKSNWKQWARHGACMGKFKNL